MGAVPVEEAKWLRSGNLATSPGWSRVGQDPRSTGRPDAVDVHQVRPGGLDRGPQFGLHQLQPGAEPDQVGQFLSGHPAPGLPHLVTRSDPRQNSLAYWSTDCLTGAPPGNNSKNSRCNRFRPWA